MIHVGEERHEFTFTPLPPSGDFFFLCVWKWHFLAHYMALLGGRLCEVACTNPLLPLFRNLFYSNRTERRVLLPLSFASDSGAARICRRAAKARGRSNRAGGRVWEVVSPSHGRTIFENLCMKTAFSCTLGQKKKKIMLPSPDRP